MAIIAVWHFLRANDEWVTVQGTATTVQIWGLARYRATFTWEFSGQVFTDSKRVRGVIKDGDVRTLYLRPSDPSVTLLSRPTYVTATLWALGSLAAAFMAYIGFK
jgi:hypothetical protein